ncbi:MAG: hypothetical protein A2X35_06490 [Elusimicrobia bacterium GWA2_61_42]|nr:MAG: hypothetical protein A2X35_06490 [Elusimicrobia bacterium GWA2_61_42]OGR78797.1 MAG: hypothetical protein A2X38_04435 [Elusimicrobia bacterium GWC2_61_25]
MLSLLLQLSLFLPALTAPALALEARDQAVLDACVLNISNKVYSPEEAGKCLEGLNADDYALYKKIKAEDPDKLSYVLKYDNLFIELGEFFEDKPNQCRLRERFIAVMEKDADQEGCVMCELQLGPEAEKSFPWIEKYYGEALPRAKKAALSWSELEAGRKTSLAELGCAEERWNTLTVRRRIAVLIADDVIKSREPGFYELEEQARCSTISFALASYIRIFLPGDLLAKLTEHLRKLQEAAKAGAAGTTGSDKSKYDKAFQTGKGLAAKSDSELLSYLGSTFDRATPGTAPLPHPAAPVPLSGAGPAAASAAAAPVLTPADSVKVAAALKANFLGTKERTGEFAGEPTGDALREFYGKKDKGGKLQHDLQLRVLDLGTDGTSGAYCPYAATKGCGESGQKAGEIAINKHNIEAWLKKNNCTTERLLGDPAMMDKLSRHLAPVAVHEGVHQVLQDEYYKGKGVDNKKFLDKETEAFARQSLFLKAKLADSKTEKAYLAEADEWDLKVLGELEKGGYRGMKKFIRYYDQEGAQGAAAKNFAQMEAALKEANLRKTVPGYNSGIRGSDDCSWYQLNKCSNDQLASMNKKAYPWYEAVIAKQRGNVELVSTRLNYLNSIDISERWKTIQKSKVAALPEDE